MPTVILIGTLDTKGDEYGYLRNRLLEHGVDVVLMDVGTREPAGFRNSVRGLTGGLGCWLDTLPSPNFGGRAAIPTSLTMT